MNLIRQTTWGWLVSLDIFLGGAGGGTFIIGYILSIYGPMKDLGILCAALGPILLSLGLFCLLADLETPIVRCRKLLSGFATSWMSRGVLIQLLFVLFGFGYSLPGLWIPQWQGSSLALAVGGIGAILALTTATYHGLLLGRAKAIPLWSSPLLPILSLFVALCTGVGVVLLLYVFFIGIYANAELVETFTRLAISGTILIIFELISLGSLASIRLGVTYNESVGRLKLPFTLATVISILCIALLVFGILIRHGAYLAWISAICAILLLTAGYILRHSLIRRGYRYSLEIYI